MQIRRLAAVATAVAAVLAACTATTEPPAVAPATTGPVPTTWQPADPWTGAPSSMLTGPDPSRITPMSVPAPDRALTVNPTCEELTKLFARLHTDGGPPPVGYSGRPVSLWTGETVDTVFALDVDSLSFIGLAGWGVLIVTDGDVAYYEPFRDVYWYYKWPRVEPYRTTTWLQVRANADGLASCRPTNAHEVLTSQAETLADAGGSAGPPPP